MKVRSFLLLVLVLSGSCYERTVFNGVPIRQYPSQVIDFSSQYNSGSWSANHALHKENGYPKYGDIANTWAPLTADGQPEYLVLEVPQTARTIEIFETFNSGAIDTIYLRNADAGIWMKVYSKPAVTDLPEESRIFSVFLEETTFLADAIRLTINSPAVKGWNEIDALAITGQRKN